MTLGSFLEVFCVCFFSMCFGASFSWTFGDFLAPFGLPWGHFGPIGRAILVPLGHFWVTFAPLGPQTAPKVAQWLPKASKMTPRTSKMGPFWSILVTFSRPGRSFLPSLSSRLVRSFLHSLSRFSHLYSSSQLAHAASSALRGTGLPLQVPRSASASSRSNGL